MTTLTWIWNGCLPAFPWWCDGFLYMGMFLIIPFIFAVFVSLLKVMGGDE